MMSGVGREWLCVTVAMRKISDKVAGSVYRCIYQALDSMRIQGDRVLKLTFRID